MALAVMLSGQSRRRRPDRWTELRTMKSSEHISGPCAGNSEIRLEMEMRVPGQCPDSVAGSHPETVQRRAELPRSTDNRRIGRFV